MTAQYEIIPSNDGYYPFTVSVDGVPIREKFMHERGAQSWIDSNQAGSDIDLYLFNEVLGPELSGTDTIIQPGSEEDRIYQSQKAAHEATERRYAEKAEQEAQPETAQQKIGLDGEFTVGQEVSIQGDVYVVTQAFYVDAETAAFAEDMDESISVGWHANARLKERDNE